MRRYASRELRPAEESVLQGFREAFGGRVLELGCGAGRVTTHLARLSPDVSAIDISPAMVQHCRKACPTVSVSVGDLRDLSGVEPGSCSVIAAWCNVIDVLGPEDRRRLFEEVASRLAPAGLLVFSTHNLAYRARIRKPRDLRYRDPLRLGIDLLRLPRALFHRRRLLRHEYAGQGYAVLNDISHDFMALHYYVDRSAQERQLEQAGFVVVECRDRQGLALAAGDPAPESGDLQFVARLA